MCISIYQSIIKCSIFPFLKNDNRFHRLLLRNPSDLICFSDEYETIEYPEEEIEICSICMDKLDVKCNDVKNEKSVLLTCGHCFHEGCLKDWYKSSEQKDCPICRS